MDRFDYGDPEYFCHWCGQANWEPDHQCCFCHRFQPGTRFDRMFCDESNVRRARKLEAEA